MWGNFMDKAKGLAENLDKQINESVGIDVASSNDSAAAAVHTNVPPTALEAPDSSDHPQEDAWNDDFDFDDDDGQDNDNEETAAAPGEEEATNAQTAQINTIPQAPPAISDTVNSSTNEIVPSLAAEEDTILSPSHDVQAEKPAESGGWNPDDEVDIPDDDELHVNDNDVQEVAADNVVPNEDVEKNQDTPIPKDGMESHAPPAHDVVIESEQEQTSEQSPADIPVANEDGPTGIEESDPTTPPVDEDEDILHNETSQQPKGPSFGNMFSSFAQQAEALAHQAETLVTKLPASLDHHDDDNKDNNDPPQDTSTTKPSGGVASLFSAFPLPSSSTAMTQEEDPSTGGWAEENDDDLEFDDTTGAEEEDDGMHDSEVMNPETETSPYGTRENAGLASGQIVKTDEVAPQKDSFQSETEPPVEQSPDPTLTEPTPGPQESESAYAATSAVASNIEEDPRYRQLQEQLRLREEQLSNKSGQLTELQSMMDQQEKDLKQKLTDVKDEAKKRISRAKERYEAAEAKAQQLQSAQSSDAASQSQLIQALREEGEKLAHKQSAMEHAVRAAKLESRDWQHRSETEQEAKEKALQKIAKLESELKSTKEFLSEARKGESQAGKLEQNLMNARSDAEMKAATILSLQQQVKELTAEGKDLQEMLDKTRDEALQEAQQEKKSLRKEHIDVISDLETKLRTTEREAGVREDALRHEVAELRKRWQDAVRRADALQMDMQSSTAPLLRQLEGMERQNRLRAANWTELENRLRSELEDSVIQNETMTKERSELRTKCTRMERSITEYEQEIKQCRRTMEEHTAKMTKLESQLEEMEGQAEKREEEYTKVERLANEGVMRVRSEMTQTVMDSEERYRGQIDKLEQELRVEHERKTQLEKQVTQLLENTSMIMAPQSSSSNDAMLRHEAKPKKLRKAEGQAAILAGALGFDSDTDDDDDDGIGNIMDRGEGPSNGGGALNSFAALDQLSSKLKATTAELESLRRNLRESERVRESLVQELGEARTAKEKLPLFEVKVKELTQENREMELELQGLREDIADVREMYRTQLNVLLEEKAALMAPPTNGEAKVEATSGVSESSPVAS